MRAPSTSRSCGHRGIAADLVGALDAQARLNYYTGFEGHGVGSRSGPEASFLAGGVGSGGANGRRVLGAQAVLSQEGQAIQVVLEVWPDDDRGGAGIGRRVGVTIASSLKTDDCVVARGTSEGL